MRSSLAWVVAAALFGPILAFCQTPRSRMDIVDRLLVPDFPPRVTTLNPAERADAVRQLEATQAEAGGKRSLVIAFLLATLGSHYSRNRDYLIESLRRCDSIERDYDCSEDTAGFLIGLYESGHREVLRSLLTVGYRADGALAEMLGDFYSSVLRRTPAYFIQTIRTLSLPVQGKLCSLAGSTDGGGMPPDDLRRVREQLLRIGGPVALQCLRQVEAANKRG